MLSDFSY